MVTSLATVGMPAIVNAASHHYAREHKISINEIDIILFQGDSITDSGRKKDSNDYNSTSAMGAGYALLAGGNLLKTHAGKNLKIYNKGISGNKVFQLAERWEADCLALQPNVLSILIGVNDFWHMKNGKYEGTIETYRNDYIALLERTKQALPEVKLIIGEPFAVTGTKAVDKDWFPQFDEYRQAARDIAEQFDAVFIPYQQVFEEAQKHAQATYWTPDGVHPSLAGAELMAQAWLKAVK
jgi:lysophospholipase L1-like esterase